jgi:FMN phosphatase YigB (HAD superfamily)
MVGVPASGQHNRRPAEALLMTSPSDMVFLVDVDNTLLDSDRVAADLSQYLFGTFGRAYHDRYSALLAQRSRALGCPDFFGALQECRAEHQGDVQQMELSSWLLDYPFAERLYPHALNVLDRFRAWGPTVILSDGDAVFQPRKIARSGIRAAVNGHVLVYIHKEEMLDEVARRYPGRHYVLVDDKLRILSAVKQAWGERVTTVFVQQGRHAHDPRILAENPPADIAVASIGDLLRMDLAGLLGDGPAPDAHALVLSS